MIIVFKKKIYSSQAACTNTVQASSLAQGLTSKGQVWLPEFKPTEIKVTIPKGSNHKVRPTRSTTICQRTQGYRLAPLLLANCHNYMFIDNNHLVTDNYVLGTEPVHYMYFFFF